MGDVRGKTWQGTQLWLELEARDGEPSESIARVVADLMPDVEAILDSGDSAAKDFTLHDSGHSFRVAERMAEIASPGLLRRLTATDLSMMLLSAYLHDVGMTPPLGKVVRHHDYLLSLAGELSDQERDELRAWLDDVEDGLEPPIAAGLPTAAELRRARRLAAEYARDRHNDWGAEWIEGNLRQYASRMFPGWIEDLIALCRSHHQGFDELKADRFKPRLVGSPAEVLHLRYCACLLRVADVLDFDPERTPTVIYAHRDVEATSAIYWHKDHQLSFKLSGDRLKIYARPPNAHVHRAIDETIAAVDRELLLCKRLDDETDFRRLPGGDQLPHEWRLGTQVQDEVEPLEGRYEYIDGTFRPDTAKLLELVGGVELYRTPLAAVRELLQNAFDAVKEQIAFERLKLSDPLDEAAVARIAAQHEVSLRLERSDDSYRLVCVDSGAGMSKDILLRRFLISGAGRSREMRELERRCAEHGFTVGRTAQFGIGVLSYFLLADRLAIQTRRSVEGGDPDGTGWRFETTGMLDFGELSGDEEMRRGSRVVLDLGAGLFEDTPDDPDDDETDVGARFANALRHYLDQIVRYVDCRFRFDAVGVPVAAIDSPAGWVAHSAEDEEIALKGLIDDDLSFVDQLDDELLPSGVRMERARDEAHWEKLAEDVRSALRWVVHEGELHDGMGRYRMALPYYDLGRWRGLCFGALEPDGDAGVVLRRMKSQATFRSSGRARMSWNGMAAETDFSTGHELDRLASARAAGAVVEISWTSDRAGKLAVSRDLVEVSDAGTKALVELGEELRGKVLELVEGFDPSPFTAIEHLLVNKLPPPEAELLWPFSLQGRGSDELLEMRPIRFPCTDWSTAAVRAGGVWRGEELQTVQTAGVRGQEFMFGQAWHGMRVAPSVVGLRRDALTGHPTPVAIWEEGAREKDAADGAALAEFPPGWTALCLLRMSSSADPMSLTVWNPQCPVVRQSTKEAQRELNDLEIDEQDPLLFADEITASPQRAAGWLAGQVAHGNADLWRGLAERSEDFLTTVWRLVFGWDGAGDPPPLVSWNDTGYGKAFSIFSPAGLEHHRPGEEMFERYLPLPAEEWWVSDA